MDAIYIQKSDGSVIRCSIGRNGEQAFFDICMGARNDRGEFEPTRSGITVPIEQIFTFTNALDRLHYVMIGGDEDDYGIFIPDGYERVEWSDPLPPGEEIGL